MTSETEVKSYSALDANGAIRNCVSKSDYDALAQELKEVTRRLSLYGAQADDENDRLQAENEKLQEKYSDLIMCVAQKFPDETRHETAKRYIQQAESHDNEPEQALSTRSEGE